MKEYQYLIGKIIVAEAIIVAAIIIAQDIDGAGESIRSSSVSYTHLDVYKRQVIPFTLFIDVGFS